MTNIILKIYAIFLGLLGVVLISLGIWGIIFTYQGVSAQHITTPKTASIPEKSVAGPFTLKSQADIIKKDVLAITGGKTFSEMSQQDPQRNIWITAVTLISALNLAILAYAFSALVLLLGILSLSNGLIFYFLPRLLDREY
jgi:hypothetical protein